MINKLKGALAFSTSFLVVFGLVMLVIKSLAVE